MQHYNFLKVFANCENIFNILTYCSLLLLVVVYNSDETGNAFSPSFWDYAINCWKVSGTVPVWLMGIPFHIFFLTLWLLKIMPGNFIDSDQKLFVDLEGRMFFYLSNNVARLKISRNISRNNFTDQVPFSW